MINRRIFFKYGNDLNVSNNYNSTCSQFVVLYKCTIANDLLKVHWMIIALYA